MFQVIKVESKNILASGTTQLLLNRSSIEKRIDRSLKLTLLISFLLSLSQCIEFNSVKSIFLYNLSMKTAWLTIFSLSLLVAKSSSQNKKNHKLVTEIPYKALKIILSMLFKALKWFMITISIIFQVNMFITPQLKSYITSIIIKH